MYGRFKHKLLTLSLFLGCIFFGCTKKGVEDHTLFHHWDHFDFSDAATANNSLQAEHSLIDFIAQFPQVAPPVQSEAVRRMLSKAKPHPSTFTFFIEQYEKYLYDPNSSMRSDSYFEPVLKFIIDSADLSEGQALKYQRYLQMVQKNKVGHPATDFVFTTVQTKQTNLYSVNAPLTLLVFYEPGCPYCELLITQLRNHHLINQLINKGQLKILAIYPTGNAEIWRNYRKNLPASWINGIDENVQLLNKSLYDLRASPTIYLLDDQKNVLLKDTNFDSLADYFLSSK